MGMNKKLLVGVTIAVLALGGIAALVFSQKDGLQTHHDVHQKAAENKTTTSDTNNTTTPAVSDDVAVATASVAIEDFAFTPTTITVKKGTKVTWTNNDSAPHDVTVTSGEGPKSDRMETGDTYSYTFDTAGTFNYFCSIHPGMTAKVIVTE
jgi:plastocyanin